MTYVYLLSIFIFTTNTFRQISKMLLETVLS